MARARKKREIGLGDVVEQVAKATKLDTLVGDDCGCKERKEKLNKLFSFGARIINCPTDEQAEYINSITTRVTLQNRIELAKIYKDVYGKEIDPNSTCGDCWANHLTKLKRAIG